MTNGEEYPLTIEILVDNPCGAVLVKGQICKTRYRSDINSDYAVFDPEDQEWFWAICNEEAKLVI